MRRHSAAAYSLFISFFSFLFQVCLEEEEEKKHTDRKREREKKRKSIGSLVGLDNYCALFG